ncbi:MAG: hypothetical protein AVDCRST_MAG36-2561 [uncultured Nocardioidaceae bacterium]|uniref:Uncharacterized protein n=1 Tax=uncultured Nocardioidaceae bacterium TaxID=253824 RepID=A0A6J4MI69_9ACTN|nr:MAG: hypothetical protein AVDCRST_MAG36-2561 [uncultured Nocardioidaceae bacterium]
MDSVARVGDQYVRRSARSTSRRSVSPLLVSDVWDRHDVLDSGTTARTLRLVPAPPV